MAFAGRIALALALLVSLYGVVAALYGQAVDGATGSTQAGAGCAAWRWC